MFKKQCVEVMLALFILNAVWSDVNLLDSTFADCDLEATVLMTDGTECNSEYCACNFKWKWGPYGTEFWILPCILIHAYRMFEVIMDSSYKRAHTQYNFTWLFCTFLLSYL